MTCTAAQRAMGPRRIKFARATMFVNCLDGGARARLFRLLGRDAPRFVSVVRSVRRSQGGFFEVPAAMVARARKLASVRLLRPPYDDLSREVQS